MNKMITSLVLLLCGAAVFIFGSPYYGLFPTNKNQTYLILLCVIFLSLALTFRRSRSLSRYSSSVYALFIAAAAALFLNTKVLNLPRIGLPPLEDLTVDKFSQFLHVVPVILILTMLAGDNLKSIFLQFGRWKPALVFGLVSFLVFGVIALFTSILPSGQVASFLAGTPWILVWIFSNSFMEELWFRGIFLRKYEVLVGRNAAIVLTALIFGASHINATYFFPGGGLVFGLVVFGLGCTCAWAMYKYEGLLGAVLFHAAYDLVVIVPVLNSG
jgi:membrane protease YdiL (CAAX protease family)